MQIRIILFALCFSLLTGCTTPYKPTNNVLRMQNSMPVKEASNIIKNALTKHDRFHGICNGNGVDGGGLTGQTWKLDSKNPEIKVDSKGISLNALQIIKSYSSSGNIATAGSAGLVTSISEANRIPIKKSFSYAEIDKIIVFPEPGMTARRCAQSPGETEIIIELTHGLGHWLAIMLDNKDVDKFIAAMMVMSPKTPIETG